MTQHTEIILSLLEREGLSYGEFMQEVRRALENTDTALLDDQEIALHEYTRLNVHRSERIERSWSMPGELRDLVQAMDTPQTWMVLTEGWCGDSAQILPYLAAVAAENPRIDFRILHRDDHPDIMDRYLTNGTRSIPKLVIFDAHGSECATWGPRPSTAAQLIRDLKEEGMPRAEMYERLHLWYGRNRGEEISTELTALLGRMCATMQSAEAQAQ